MPDGEERVVLVVDDVEQMTSTVADFLERRIPGLKVAALTRPKDALAWLQAASSTAVEDTPHRNAAAPRVALILSDNHMDEMDGLEFLAQCRRLAPQAARALMTAYLDVQPPRIAAAGLHAVIRKPWEWTEFARFAHEMMGLTPDDKARLEAGGPLAYPRDALAEFAAPRPQAKATEEAPMPARPLPAPPIDRIPLAPPAPGPRPVARAPAPRACPHCHAPLETPEPLSDEEEAWRIVALLQARPGIAQRFLAIQAARGAPPKGPPPGARKPK